MTARLPRLDGAARAKADALRREADDLTRCLLALSATVAVGRAERSRAAGIRVVAA